MTSLRVMGLLAACAALGACTTGAGGPQRVAAVAPTLTPPPTMASDSTPYGLFLAGRAARDEGRLGAAATYLGKAAQAEGEPDYLKADAFHAAIEAGDITTAAALAPQGADTAPSDVGLGHLVQGVEAMANGQDKPAYPLLANPETPFPFKAAALLIAPFAAAGAGDQANALARPALIGDPLSQFVGDLDQAELDERLGKASDAEAGYKALLQRGDPGGVVSLAYGGFLERHDRPGDAATTYQTALGRSPDDAQLAAALARTKKHGRAPAIGSLRGAASQALILPAAGLIAQKQQGLALIDLRLALRLDPANDEAWILVGDLLAQADVDTARAAFRSVAPSSEEYVIARNKLALSYQDGGDHAQALVLARETAASNPKSHDAQVTLANLLRDDEQYTESAGVLTKLIEAPGAKPDWRLYFLRASAYDQLGDADKTQADLTAALKLNPDEPELLNFQGYFWIDRGEHLNDALAMVQRAVESQPESGAMIDSLGWAYYRLGDFKSAVSELENAVTLDPSIPEVNDHLGDAYWRVGRKTEAVFEWRRALSLAPDAKLKTRLEGKLASPLGPDASAGAPPPEIKTP